MKKVIRVLRTSFISLLIILFLCIGISLHVLAVEENVSEATNEITDENVTDENTKSEITYSIGGSTVDDTEKQTSEERTAQPVPQRYSGVAIVEISSYTLEGGILAAGKDISVVLTLHNLSSTKSADNIMLTVSSMSGMVYPSYGNDNQIFVGRISEDEYLDVSVPLTISPTFTGNSVDLNCQFDYLSDGFKMSNSSSMIITTTGGDRLNVKSVDVSTHSILNGKSLISINYTNKSNVNITDASLIIEGNVSSDSKTIPLGTVFAGKSYSKDCNVTFVKAGNQEINVKLSYTDAEGDPLVTDLGKFSVDVSEETEPEIIEKQDFMNGLFWGGIILALVSGLLIVYFVYNYIRKR